MENHCEDFALRHKKGEVFRCSSKNRWFIKNHRKVRDKTSESSGKKKHIVEIREIDTCPFCNKSL